MNQLGGEMALQSMTGFSRTSAAYGDNVVSWEVRSVNGKSADIRLRVPSGFERYEQPVKKAVRTRFSRGNFSAVLTITRQTSQMVPVVNEAFLKDIAELAQRLEQQFGCRPAAADGLLALKGVLEQPEMEADLELAEKLDHQVMENFEAALDGLEAARREEGEALFAVLTGHLKQIEELTLRAEADKSREPSAIRERLQIQLAPLLDVSQLDETRLYQEAALLATKADITEEIDRLKTHIASGRKLLSSQGPAGRKLDFLAQELNRESNTLCSKSNAGSITTIGMKLKVEVDRFREQVQNLE